MTDWAEQGQRLPDGSGLYIGASIFEIGGTYAYIGYTYGTWTEEDQDEATPAWE